MTMIRRLRYAPEAATGLCATCTWGTVRKGFRDGQVETFCRLVSPNNLVPFVIRECTDYSDRRVPCVTAEAKPTDRRFGFVTTFTLREAHTKSSP